MKYKDLGTTIRTAISGVVEWEGTPYVAITLILLCLLFPFYWIVMTSLRPLEEVRGWPPTLIPQHFSISGYKSALSMTPTLTHLLNSTIYSLSVAAIVTAITTLTTYGLSIYPYRGSDKIFFAFFATRTIPPQSLWLPLTILFSKLGLINTRAAVIIFSIALTYPLSIWMLKGLFDAFPRELVDAASLDGCSKLGVLARVVMPIVAPGIAAIGIIAFLGTWATFMFPFLVLNSKALMPITVGVFYFVGDESIAWHAISAVECMAIVPGIVFFAIAQKYIVRGLASGFGK